MCPISTIFQNWLIQNIEIETIETTKWHIYFLISKTFYIRMKNNNNNNNNNNWMTSPHMLNNIGFSAHWESESFTAEIIVT